MDQKIKNQIIAYVHSTLEMVEGADRAAIWDAAIKLSRLNLNEIDAFKASLAQDVADELSSLIDLVKDPNEHYNIAANELSAAQKFILQTIGTHAANIKISPPRALPDKDLEEIAAHQQQNIEKQIKTAQVKKPANSPNNVDHASIEELQQDREQFYNSTEGQHYLTTRLREMGGRPPVNANVYAMMRPTNNLFNFQSYDGRFAQSVNMQQITIPGFLNGQFSVINTGYSASIIATFTQNQFAMDAAASFVSYMMNDTGVAFVYHAFNTLFPSSAPSSIYGTLRPGVAVPFSLEETAVDEHRVSLNASQNQPANHFLSEMAQHVSNQAYALWESTVGVQVASNLSSMWQRTRAQVSGLFNSVQQAPSEEQPNRRMRNNS